MAVSDSFLTFVLEQLGELRQLSSRRLFGGVGLYSGETFFAILDNDTLFFKVDETTTPRYVSAGMPPFQPIPGRPPMFGYYQVPPRVLEDRDEIVEWAAAAIAVGVRAARSGRRRASMTVSRVTAARPGPGGRRPGGRISRASPRRGQKKR